MTYTLAADGSSDRVLLPLLTWSLERHGIGSVLAQWADFQRIPPQPNLAARLNRAIDLYPCDILFVHRDSEGQSRDIRCQEISDAVAGLATIRHVPVIPVRMTEAWLLFDESAIRRAAGNPNGRQDLHLRPVRELERLADPKKTLHDAIVRRQ